MMKANQKDLKKIYIWRNLTKLNFNCTDFKLCHFQQWPRNTFLVLVPACKFKSHCYLASYLWFYCVGHFQELEQRKREELQPLKQEMITNTVTEDQSILTGS